VMGVVGASSGGAGVVGASTASPPSPSGRIGVYGYATASGSSGVFGINPFAGGVGVWGHGAQIGVSATTNSASGYGLWAENTATTGFATAIRARVVSTGTPAAIWAEGSGSGHGVFATQTTLGVDGRAAISARNPTTSVAGSPATALDIDGGITMNTTRADRAAGQTSIALGGCSGASPVMQSGSIVLNNNQITATSLILATALGTSAVAYPVTVRITAQGPGSATLTAYAIGQGTTCPSIGNIAVNYLIINQR
jgi:hypothetical protein